MSEGYYKNWAGYDQTEFSYSLASDLNKCGHYTQLTRIQGLTKKVESAAFKFGIAVEEAVTFHYQTGADVEMEFSKRWEFWRDKVLDYSDRDGDWNGCLIKGRGLMREFMKQKGELPDLSKAIFQEKMRIPNWSEHGDLIYIADAYLPDRSLLLDLKTASASYPEGEDVYPSDPGRRWPAFDPQLRVGALVSGIRKVGFIVFVKTKIPKIQYLEAQVSDELVADIDGWLREQHDKLIGRKFFRNSGYKFPNQACTFCDVAAACMGNEELAKDLLKQRETKISKLNELVAGRFGGWIGASVAIDRGEHSRPLDNWWIPGQIRATILSRSCKPSFDRHDKFVCGPSRKAIGGSERPVIGRNADSAVAAHSKFGVFKCLFGAIT